MYVSPGDIEEELSECREGALRGTMDSNLDVELLAPRACKSLFLGLSPLASPCFHLTNKDGIVT